MKIDGKLFKDAIGAICKFPAVGSFAGADLLHLSAQNNKLKLVAVSGVLAHVLTSCDGDLPLCAVDRRAVEAFASICGTSVSISQVDKELVLVSRSRDVKIPMGEAQSYKAPLLKEKPFVKITPALASRLTYLADVAFGDSSRPELCCVLLTGSDAVACNQRTVAVFGTGQTQGKIAVPLLIAKNVSAGDKLYPGKHETALRSGIATYTMSTPMKAQAEYPIVAVRQLGKNKRSSGLTVAGNKLANAVSECSTCLTGLARTETVVELSIVEGKLHLVAANGGARFRAKVPVLSNKLTAEQASEVLYAPLDGLLYAVPFMDGQSVKMARGEKGDTYFEISSGWILYPAWIQKKEKKK